MSDGIDMSSSSSAVPEIRRVDRMGRTSRPKDGKDDPRDDERGPKDEDGKSEGRGRFEDVYEGRNPAGESDRQRSDDDEPSESPVPKDKGYLVDIRA